MGGVVIALHGKTQRRQRREQNGWVERNERDGDRRFSNSAGGAAELASMVAGTMANGSGADDALADGCIDSVELRDTWRRHMERKCSDSGGGRTIGGGFVVAA